MAFHSKDIERIMEEMGYDVSPPFNQQKPLTALRESFFAIIDKSKILFKAHYIPGNKNLQIVGFFSDGNEEIIEKFGFGGVSDLPFLFVVRDCIVKLEIDSSGRICADIKRTSYPNLEMILKTPEDFDEFISNNGLEKITCERSER